MVHHDCGGTILSGGSGEQEHDYCDRCHAFRYAALRDEPFPRGTHEPANRQAWDDGDEQSPE